MFKRTKYVIKGSNSHYYVAGLTLYTTSTGLGSAKLYNSESEATTRMKTMNRYLPSEYKPLEVVPVTIMVQEVYNNVK